MPRIFPKTAILLLGVITIGISGCAGDSKVRLNDKNSTPQCNNKPRCPMNPEEMKRAPDGKYFVDGAPVEWGTATNGKFGFRICSALAPLMESYPPQCGGAAIDATGLNEKTIQAINQVTTFQGVWSQTRQTLTVSKVV